MLSSSSKRMLQIWVLGLHWSKFLMAQLKCWATFQNLTETQRKYSTYDLELLSIFSAVTHFEYMLLDKTFTIFCDKPLVNSFRKPSQSHTPRQARQLSYLSQFDCMIQHLLGKSNTVADCLSRAAPLTICHISETSNLPTS